MTKKKIFTFFLVFFLISACSFDNKSGIWSGEKKRVSKLEKEQKEVEIEKKREIINVYSSESVYSKEVSLKKKIKTSDPIKNLSWQVSSLNNQNYKGNLYLSGTENIFLKQLIFDFQRYWIIIFFHSKRLIILQ